MKKKRYSILSLFSAILFSSCSVNPQNNISVLTSQSPKNIEVINKPVVTPSISASPMPVSQTPEPQLTEKNVSYMNLYSDQDEFNITSFYYDSFKHNEKNYHEDNYYNVDLISSAKLYVKGLYEKDPLPVVSPTPTSDKDKAIFNGKYHINEYEKDDDIECYWSSSDPSIATIDKDGNIKGIKEGNAIITAIAKRDKTASLSIKLNVYKTLIRSYEFYGCNNESTTYSIGRHNFWNQTYADGTIFDSFNNPISGVNVSIRSLDNDYEWSTDDYITGNDGKYVFKNIPPDIRYLITARKDGYTIRDRAEVPHVNLDSDPNTYDFAGIYAIQDEPEINCVQINSQQVSGAVKNDSFINNQPTIKKYKNLFEINSTNTYIPSIENINPEDINLTFGFSEPVIREDVENYFRVVSNILGKDIIIDKKTNPEISFTWTSDDKNVVIKLPDLLSRYSNNDKLQLRYSVEFSQPFRDKSGNKAITERYFRFSPSQINDYFVFSVKNNTSQDNNSKLTDIIAKNNLVSPDSVNDSIELQFNKLSTGLSPDLTGKILLSENTNNDGNNFTVIGYKNSYGTIIPIYCIGLVKTDIQGNIKLSCINGVIKNIRVKNNSILLDLSNTSFEKNDNLILSIGKTISGYYSINGKSFNADTKSNFAPFEKVIDVFGNELINDKDKNIITVE